MMFNGTLCEIRRLGITLGWAESGLLWFDFGYVPR